MFKLMPEVSTESYKTVCTHFSLCFSLFPFCTAPQKKRNLKKISLASGREIEEDYSRMLTNNLPLHSYKSCTVSVEAKAK